ncbi:MAG TPA: barstar family protein [Segeticoccus sp.]|nr:barstar family protein [Segeticoccus sp.]
MTLQELLSATEGRVVPSGSIDETVGDDLVEEAERAAGDAGWRFVHLDTEGAADKRRALEQVQEAFALPEWFGHNWDALADALSDVTDDRGVLVVWTGAEALGGEDEDTYATLLDVLRDRADDDDPRAGGPFCVVLA